MLTVLLFVAVFEIYICKPQLEIIIKLPEEAPHPMKDSEDEGKISCPNLMDMFRVIVVKAPLRMTTE